MGKEQVGRHPGNEENQKRFWPSAGGGSGKGWKERENPLAVNRKEKKLNITGNRRRGVLLRQETKTSLISTEEGGAN